MAKDNERYLMYMHAGSGNHGCEAIVRSLCSLLDAPCTVLSNHPDEDKAAGLTDVCEIIPSRRHEGDLFHRALYYAARKLTGNASAQMKYSYAAAAPFDRYRAALSVGGDNYCYDDALTDLAGANLLFNDSGIPTALVGCSVEPGILNRPSVIDDLSRFSCIIARESVSYNALREALPVRMAERIFLAPDPAFLLPAAAGTLPKGFKEGHTIGINISPMIMNYEKDGSDGIILRNYKKLIDTILEETADVVLLIPHVVTPASNDMIPIRRLYEDYRDSGRVFMMEDSPAEKIKYVISRCRLLITARTHASIAAYSSCVPTLVAGYSVKAHGIATDLFGRSEGYVCPVQDLKTDSDLTDAYTELEAYADDQRRILSERIPGIIKKAEDIRKILSEVAYEH